MTAERPRRPAVHFLYLSYNFLYPASALCMLAGLWLLNDAMDVKAAQLPLILALLGILQLYEFSVIGLAVYLLRRRRMVMDARLLLALAIPFIVDLAHLNAEAFGVDLYVGIGVNAAVFLLAVVKAIIVARALEVRWAPGNWAMLGVSFLFLLVLPGALAAISRRHEIGPWDMYGAWWAAGIMLAAHAMWPSDRRGRAHWPDVARLVRRRIIVAVHLSIMLHLVTQGWVYRVSFDVAFLAPILLGAAFAWPWAKARRLEPATIVRHQYRLAAAALIASLGFKGALHADLPQVLGATLSPLRLTLIAVAVILTMAAWRRRAFAHVIVAAGCLAAAALGHSFAAMGQTLAELARLVASLLRNVTPRTRQGWGVVALAAAFALLMAGAAVSIVRSRVPRRPAEPSP